MLPQLILARVCNLIRSPLSAMMSSPGCKTYSKALFTTISLCDVVPGYNSLANAVAPLGVIPIKAFVVVLDLYCG